MHSTLRREHFGISLKWTATVAAGICVGGYLYITFIETPARSQLPPKHDAQMMQMTHEPTRKIWTPIALLATTCAFGGFLLTYPSEDDAEWLLADTLLLGTIPVILCYVWPTGTAIMDSKDTDDVSTERGENWLACKLNLWSKYHNLRSTFGAMAFGYMVYLHAKRN